jgi:hypothetical protein
MSGYNEDTSGIVNGHHATVEIREAPDTRMKAAVITCSVITAVVFLVLLFIPSIGPRRRFKTVTVASDCNELQAKISEALDINASSGTIIHIPAGTVCQGPFTFVSVGSKTAGSTHAR